MRKIAKDIRFIFDSQPANNNPTASILSLRRQFLKGESLILNPTYEPTQLFGKNQGNNLFLLLLSNLFIKYRSHFNHFPIQLIGDYYSNLDKVRNSKRTIEDLNTFTLRKSIDFDK